MKVYFDDEGYPETIIFTNLEKEALESNNFHSIRELYLKLKRLCDYWSVLEDKHQSFKYGEITKLAYQRLVNKQQKLFFIEKIFAGYKKAYIEPLFEKDNDES